MDLVRRMRLGRSLALPAPESADFNRAAVRNAWPTRPWYARSLSAMPDESAATPRAVLFERVLDDRQARRHRLEVIHFHALAFQRLVVLEETPQHHQPVRRQFGRFDESVVLRIVHGDGQDF